MRLRLRRRLRPRRGLRAAGGGSGAGPLLGQVAHRGRQRGHRLSVLLAIPGADGRRTGGRAPTPAAAIAPERRRPCSGAGAEAPGAGDGGCGRRGGGRLGASGLLGLGARPLLLGALLAARGCLRLALLLGRARWFLRAFGFSARSAPRAAPRTTPCRGLRRRGGSASAAARRRASAPAPGVALPFPLRRLLGAPLGVALLGARRAGAARISSCFRWRSSFFAAAFCSRGGGGAAAGAAAGGGARVGGAGPARRGGAPRAAARWRRNRRSRSGRRPAWGIGTGSVPGRPQLARLGRPAPMSATGWGVSTGGSGGFGGGGGLLRAGAACAAASSPFLFLRSSLKERMR